jgi:hypothetical protein
MFLDDQLTPADEFGIVHHVLHDVDFLMYPLDVADGVPNRLSLRSNEAV